MYCETTTESATFLGPLLFKEPYFFKKAILFCKLLFLKMLFSRAANLQQLTSFSQLHFLFIISS